MKGARMNAIKITSSGEISEIQINDTDKLHELQIHIGGYIQQVRILGTLTMLMNEEGKLHRLPENEFATYLYQSWVYPQDSVVGDVVLVKMKDGEYIGWNESQGGTHN